MLVVEDEESIRDLVCFHLDLAGYECVSIGDGTDALRLATEQTFDLLVLDLALPGLDGLRVCRVVRKEGPNRNVPILILTARREESDKVLGLESGADDYLTKPFGVREFVARASALMRRRRGSSRSAASPPPSGCVVARLGITIDPSRHRVSCDGHFLSLTHHEFSLLYLLVSNPGIVFSREELLVRLWPPDVFIAERGVDALVRRVRRKIESDPRRPTRIVTVWGVGYKFGDE